MFEETLPKDEITKLKRAFALFDVDGDGSISTKELAKVMTSLGACPPWAVLESMIDGADSDRNGKIDFAEFVMLMTEAEKDNQADEHVDEKHKIEERIKQREEEVCDLFYLFDRDRSGEISLDELSRVMVQFGGLSKEEIDVMLLEADTDGDGMVEYEEFSEMMRRPGETIGKRRASEIWDTIMARHKKNKKL